MVELDSGEGEGQGGGGASGVESACFILCDVVHNCWMAPGCIRGTGTGASMRSVEEQR